MQQTSITVFHLSIGPIFQPRGDYLAFIGRMSPEKRPDRAIAIARGLGIPLKIAAKVDRADEAYFRARCLTDPTSSLLGRSPSKTRTRFWVKRGDCYFRSIGLAFGLVMIEAMACGTPVLAFRCGSVPEIIDEGVSGMIVETMDQAIAAVPRLLAMDRRAVRMRFEERFSSTRMARHYVHLYRKLLLNVRYNSTETQMAEGPASEAFKADVMN